MDHSLTAVLLSSLLCTSPAFTDPRDVTREVLSDRELPARATPEAYAIASRLAVAASGRVGFVADTRSMQPTLTAVDLVVIAPVAAVEDLHEGDVVAFWTKTSRPWERVLVVHRLVQKVHAHEIRTRGDNGRADACTTKQSNLLGIVAYAVDGRTGAIRDLRVSRGGSAVSLDTALARAAPPAAAAPTTIR